jgi:hypothetical protein
MVRWLDGRIRSLLGPHELDEPFRAEVLLDNRVVALLSDRVWTEMFWRSYRITPVGDPSVIADDMLWMRCRFEFRDPATGRVCKHGFASEPFVRDGRVFLRGMYF